MFTRHPHAGPVSQVRKQPGAMVTDRYHPSALEAGAIWSKGRHSNWHLSAEPARGMLCLGDLPRSFRREQVSCT